MNHSIKYFATTAVFIAASFSASAADRCPASYSGCTVDNAHEQIRSRVREGAENVWRGTNSQGRVREVRDTLRYCVTCGTDAIKNGMDRISLPTKYRANQ